MSIATMDANGFLPAHNCSRCARPLHGEGSGRPAELYAGTYTGLCYDCEHAGVYTVKTHPDGARLLSYPPHCPSWRRDRETYFAYADCEACAGTGRKYIPRSDGQGGSYYEYCKPCLAQLLSHPVHVAHSAAVEIHTEAAGKIRAKLEKRFKRGETREALLAEWKAWLAENPRPELPEEWQ